MTEDKRQEMLLEHDHQICTLAQSVESLAIATGGSGKRFEDIIGKTNEKLDDVIKAIAQQTVFVERLNNMDLNIREFAIDVHKDITEIKELQSGNGCSALHISQTKLHALGRSMDGLRERVIITEEKVTSKISCTAIQWGAGLLVVGLLGLLGFINAESSNIQEKIHVMDTAIVKQEGRDVNREKRIENLEGLIYIPQEYAEEKL